MCGIVGIFDSRGRQSFDEALLQRMNDSLIHRGPDDGGRYMEPGLALGHRRLSILDLSPAGHQPMLSDDGKVIVVFNGEIYNFMDLRKELEAEGHSFRSHCDTEVLVKGWQTWGEGLVDRLRGMFAFAVWDADRETVFLARDRLGIKPLYYTQLSDGRLAFASELKALYLLPGLPRDIDPQAVEDYFAYGYIPDPKTILKSVRKLPPGYVLRQRRGEPVAEPRQYWDLSFHPDDRLDQGAVSEELPGRLSEAVKIRMIADVPLGSFLSGGVDSSAVVAMMADLTPDAINTYSIGFDQPEYDERDYALEVAERYRTRHTTRVVNPDDFDLVDKLADLYDEPYADSSAMPTYRVCQLAREHVTVALSGDGGDELFAGYRRHRWHAYEQKIRDLIPSGLRRPMFGFLGRAYPKLDWAPKLFRAKSTFEALGFDAAEGYFHSVSVLPARLRRQMFSPSFASDLQGYDALTVLRDVMDNAPVEDELSRIQYADVKTYLPGDILTKVDRASMAHSLEVRVPILDHKFMEWAARIPPRLHLENRQGKMAFKRALEGRLSENTLYRDKMGFAVPLENWFRGPLRDKIRTAVDNRTLADTGLFDMSFLKRLVDEHQSGRWNHSAALWAILMFEKALKRAVP